MVSTLLQSREFWISILSAIILAPNCHKISSVTQTSLQLRVDQHLP